VKKCTPVTLSARPETAPSFTIGMELVLEARMASSFFSRALTLRKSSSLIDSTSPAASTTRSLSARSFSSVVNETRCSVWVTPS
jgi:hypothetical protein